MANVSRPSGLRPVKHVNGSAWNGAVETFALLAADATVVGVGDVVNWGGTADANGVASITRASADTGLPVGVVVGFEPDFSNLNTPGQYRAANTARYARVCVDPSVVYEVQAGAATAITAIGMNMGLNYTAVNTTTGLSAMTALGGAGATTATLPLKVLGVAQRPDSDMSDSANWKLLVTLNSSNLAGNTAGVA
jgi:hypothetical protein